MLTEEELVHFSEELKHFLIVNGVHAEEWEKMNHEEPSKARDLVGLFSDSILQRVYEKLSFLEFRSSDSCMLFHLGKERIDLVSIQAKQGGNVDLSTPEGIHTALKEHAGQLAYFQTQKTYNATRELEIHRFLEQGCVPSSEEFWNNIQEVIQ